MNSYSVVVAAGRRLILFLSLAVLVAFSIRVESAETNTIWFKGREIFPIDPQILQIRAADINADGKIDLIVANNSRSKINLLINQTGETNLLDQPASVSENREINELPPDARFRIESIASEKRIASLSVADFNSDGRPDIAYFGDPKELVLQYNEGNQQWSAPKRWALDDGLFSPNALGDGDLNGDGLADLVLLAENHIYLLAQNKEHEFNEPEKIPFTGTVKSVQVLDIDGDQRDDLLLVNWESSTPFHFRLQNESGRLGPEVYFSLPPIRAYWADELEKGGKTKVMTIAQNSGRAQIAEFTRKPAEELSGAFRKGQFEILPLRKTSKSRRGMIWADVNGDHLPDLLVADPDAGELALYQQTPDGSTSAIKEFPSLTGISDLDVADWDGDGTSEVFLLSADERQVGVTSLDENGRLPFPTLLPTGGRPLALTVGALKPGGDVSLFVLVDKEGKRELLIRSHNGTSRIQKLSANFKSNPSTVKLHDVDQDGLNDLIILIPYEKVKILRQVADGDFEEIDLAPPGGSADNPWMTVADVDGDGKNELLLAQKNFLRAVILKRQESGLPGDEQKTWNFDVKEQINGSASNSRLVGATAVTNGTNKVASLFLLDAEKKCLTLCERDDSAVWQPKRNIDLPYTTDLRDLQAVDFGGATNNGVALLGLNAVAWQRLSGDVWEFTELDGYETPIKDGRLNDVTTGDLNNDGRKDLIFLESNKHYVDLVIFEPPNKLVPANRWQVFEERSFRGMGSGQPEPREALVADVTGDGKNDLVVVVHDRVLVYPQE